MRFESGMFKQPSTERTRAAKAATKSRPNTAAQRHGFPPAPPSGASGSGLDRSAETQPMPAEYTRKRSETPKPRNK